MAKPEEFQSIIAFLAEVHRLIQTGSRAEAATRLARFIRTDFDPSAHRFHLAQVAALVGALGSINAQCGLSDRI